jgi:hypothetical protein
MQLVQSLAQFSNSSIYLCPPIKNTILENGLFIRFLQSTEHCIFNSISIDLPLKSVTFEQYFNKKKCTFNSVENNYSIQKLIQIEKQLLKSANIKDKDPVFTLKTQLEKSFIKKCYLNCNSNQLHKSYDKIDIIFKISGIWEDNNQYGLTFRFIIMN